MANVGKFFRIRQQFCTKKLEKCPKMVILCPHRGQKGQKMVIFRLSYCPQPKSTYCFRIVLPAESGGIGSGLLPGLSLATASRRLP